MTEDFKFDYKDSCIVVRVNKIDDHALVLLFDDNDMCPIPTPEEGTPLFEAVMAELQMYVLRKAELVAAKPTIQ